MQNSKSDEMLAKRRKRLVFRACHRGIREMDILLGGFAARHIDELDETELDRFEALLEEPDQQLLAWMTGQARAPERLDGRLIEAIRQDAVHSQDQ